jgi:uncharacterized lipoprotein YmbA
MKRFSPSTILAAAVLTAALCGCLNLKPVPDPTRFYVLPCPAVSNQLPAATRLGWSVCVAKVETPAYLDRPAIAVRQADNRIEYLELHQWAEPVQEGLSRCLREGLAGLLGPGRVAPLQYRRPAGPCLEVQASVAQFELAAAGQAILRVRWRLVETGTGRVRHAQISELVHPTPAPTAAPAKAVDALSQVVALWSRQVAEAVLEKCAGEPPRTGPTASPGAAR